MFFNSFILRFLFMTSSITVFYLLLWKLEITHLFIFLFILIFMTLIITFLNLIFYYTFPLMACSITTLDLCWRQNLSRIIFPGPSSSFRILKHILNLFIKLFCFFQLFFKFFTYLKFLLKILLYWYFSFNLYLSCWSWRSWIFSFTFNVLWFQFLFLLFLFII